VLSASRNFGHNFKLSFPPLRGELTIAESLANVEGHFLFAVIANSAIAAVVFLSLAHSS